MGSPSLSISLVIVIIIALYIFLRLYHGYLLLLRDAVSINQWLWLHVRYRFDTKIVYILAHVLLLSRIIKGSSWDSTLVMRDWERMSRSYPMVLLCREFLINWELIKILLFVILGIILAVRKRSERLREWWLVLVMERVMLKKQLWRICR